jgi:thioester reductase-like protein
MDNILLTGGTGNLGGRILIELLKKDVNIILLVRESDIKKSEEVISKVLEFWIGKSFEDVKEKIEIISGDITQKNLGITNSKQMSLLKKVTHVIHCAGILRLDLSIEEARKIIFAGTKEVVDSVMDNTNFKKFNYISTMEITGNLQGTVKEEFLDEYDINFLNTYEQAKFETEAYLKDLNESKHVPISIFRPSLVVGDSKTGKIMNPQSFYHIIEDLFITPKGKVLPGTDNFRIDTISLDVIGEVLASIYDNKESNGKIYHLTSGVDGYLNLSDFLIKLQSIYEKKTGIKKELSKFINPKIFYYLINIIYPLSFGSLKKNLKIQKIFIKFFLLNVKFDNSNLVDFCLKQHIELPKLENYLETLVENHLTKKKEK